MITANFVPKLNNFKFIRDIVYDVPTISANWLPPEWFNGQEKFSYNCDIFR